MQAHTGAGGTGGQHAGDLRIAGEVLDHRAASARADQDVQVAHGIAAAAQAAGGGHLDHSRHFAQIGEQALGYRRHAGQQPALRGMQQQLDRLQEFFFAALAEPVQLANLSAAGGPMQLGRGLDAQFVPQAADPPRAEAGYLEQFAQAGRDLTTQSLE
ncbi:hypothetical protein D3C75_593910 [compost metagenome]